MITTPPIMLKAPILAYLVIWAPKVSPIYLQLLLLLRRPEGRTFDVLVFAHFSFWWGLLDPWWVFTWKLRWLLVVWMVIWVLCHLLAGLDCVTLQGVANGSTLHLTGMIKKQRPILLFGPLKWAQFIYSFFYY